MARPTALVTGASSGIGAAFARQLAATHDLILTARRAEVLTQLAEAVGHATVIPADLADPLGAKALIAEIERRGLAVDLLINNAGFGVTGPVAENDPTALDEMVTVNVAALTSLTRAFLPGMLARRAGAVLNVASTAGFQPGPGMAGYYATKAFVVSFTEALWYETRGTGVNVSALCPGPVATGFAERAKNHQSKLFQSGLVPVADAESVAAAGLAGLRAGQRLVIPGFGNRLIWWTSGLPPRWLALPVAAWMQAPAK